ncbi:MAG: AbrB/MazE/SpoVT family DNA-binding domain-containing protein, partial [Promethearchaeota archaeon]
MEIRKIQNSASGSFFVTLPKSWVKEMDIIKGEELMMSQDEEGALKISPIKNQKKYYYQFVIQIEDYPEETLLVRCINSSYIQGADVISILSKNTITLNKKNLIKNTTSSLIG